MEKTGHLVRRPRALGRVGWPGRCPFGFQGDQRDEEEETQMKKSESEVEVRAGRTGRSEVGRASLSWAWLSPFLCASRRQQPLLPNGLTTHGSSSSSRNVLHRPLRAAAMHPHPSTTDQVVPGPAPDLTPSPQVLGLSLSSTLSWRGSLPCPRTPLEKARPFIRHVCFCPLAPTWQD